MEAIQFPPGPEGPGIYNAYWSNLAYYLSDAWPFADEKAAEHNVIMKRRVSGVLEAIIVCGSSGGEEK